MKICVFSLLLAATLPSSAGIVHNALKAESQTTVSRNAQGVSSCGVRVAAFIESGKDIRWYDFSLNVYADSNFGMMKAGSYVIPVATLNKTGFPSDPRTTVRTPAPAGFWITDTSTKPPAIMLKPIASPDKGFVLGLADFSRAAEMIFGVAKGEQHQFAVKYSDRDVEDVVNFKAPLSPDDFTTLSQCFMGMQATLERQTPPTETGK